MNNSISTSGNMQAAVSGMAIEFSNSVCYTINNKPATPLNNAHFRQALSFSGLIV